MGYLVLARRIGEKIILRASPGADPAALLAQLAGDGIIIGPVEIDRNQVKLGIQAPPLVRILRSEMEGVSETGRRTKSGLEEGGRPTRSGNC